MALAASLIAGSAILPRNFLTTKHTGLVSAPHLLRLLRYAKNFLPFTGETLPLTQVSLSSPKNSLPFTQVSLPSPKNSLSFTQVSLSFPKNVKKATYNFI